MAENPIKWDIERVKTLPISQGKKVKQGMRDAPLQIKSHAPRGGDMQVAGDLGNLTQIETHKAFPRPIKKAGPNVRNPLHFRKPAIANDSTERKVMWPRKSAHNDVYKGAGGSYVG